MKKFLIFIFFGLTTQITYSQDCTMYFIEFEGTIKSDKLKIERIKLPTFEFLIGKKEDPYFVKRNYFKKIEDNKIDTNLFGGHYDYYHYWVEPEKLLNLFKTKRKTFPIIIEVTKKGKKEEIKIDLDWNYIEFCSGKKGVFKMKLNEVNIKNYTQQSINKIAK